jgi:hypothetical protein
MTIARHNLNALALALLDQGGHRALECGVPS